MGVILRIRPLLSLLLLIQFFARANEARMLMNCTSVRVSTASVKQSGQTYALGFTTDDSEVNGEWYVSDGNARYASLALLDVPGFGGPMAFSFYVDLPNITDTDADLVTDFFQVSRAVSGADTTGTMTLDTGEDVIQGFVTATWNRAAGATTGTVQLRVNLVRDLFLPVLTFTHPFEIYQYDGKLTYTVKGAKVEAAVNLMRQGKAGQFTGPFPMTRRSQTELVRAEAGWFGPGNEAYTVLGSVGATAEEMLLVRGATASNYSGSFYFLDGVPSTPFLDEYDLWNVQIIDPNDADGNHIPDLTDGTEYEQPAGPVAKLVAVGDQLTLTITAKSGQQVVIEQRADLDAAAWEEVETRTLAADSEDVSLTAPAEGARFYRVRTP
jgi:hypothetical protein